MMHFNGLQIRWKKVIPLRFYSIPSNDQTPAVPFAFRRFYFLLITDFWG